MMKNLVDALAHENLNLKLYLGLCLGFQHSYLDVWTSWSTSIILCYHRLLRFHKSLWGFTKSSFLLS